MKIAFLTIILFVFSSVCAAAFRNYNVAAVPFHETAREEYIKSDDRINKALTFPDEILEQKFNEARRQYFELEFRKAIENLYEVRSNSCLLPLLERRGELCFKSLMLEALLTNSESDEFQVSKLINRALVIRPHAKLSTYEFPPSIRSKFIELQNEKNKNEGKLIVKSDISNSSVFINGTYYGNTPLDKNFPIGKYNICVKSKWKKSYKQIVEIKSHDQIVMNVELKNIEGNKQFYASKN